jgi:hypothetical protein
MRIRTPELKIKIKSLAAEARIIRHDEQKAHRAARVAETQVMVLEGRELGHARKRLLDETIIHPEVPGHPLHERQLDAAREDLAGFFVRTPKVAPAVLIARAKAERETFRSLQDHRRALVGREARVALLAYAFLRGRPYSSVEVANTYEAPPWQAVLDNVERFGGKGHAAAFGAWVSAGIEHLRTGHRQGRVHGARLVIPPFAR